MIEQPKGGDWHKMGKVIDDCVFKYVSDKTVLWEERLRLHIKPRPSWCPEKLWLKLITLVVQQTIAEPREGERDGRTKNI